MSEPASEARAQVLPTVRPGRSITSMSALLLPHDDEGGIDWDAYVAHLERTVACGLVPAVNMDTGYVQLLDDATRAEVLDVAAEYADGTWVGGACVVDGPGDAFDLAALQREVDGVQRRGGVPIVFPSNGLNALDPEAWVEAHRQVAADADRFLAFELGPQFVPFGRIYPMEAYLGLLDIQTCLGAKHSSLRRQAEWDRLEARDVVRPEFLVLTGNDLAIDMVMYGSDYLLGLSTFAPDLFARRDRWWAEGDARFFEANDLLQYLGQFAFRAPVPAYRHDAALFLQLRGWTTGAEVPPGVPLRPEGEVAVLADIAARVETLVHG